MLLILNWLSLSSTMEVRLRSHMERKLCAVSSQYRELFEMRKVYFKRRLNLP
jgi:hypothetical protein